MLALFSIILMEKTLTTFIWFKDCGQTLSTILDLQICGLVLIFAYDSVCIPALKGCQPYHIIQQMNPPCKKLTQLDSDVTALLLNSLMVIFLQQK